VSYEGSHECCGTCKFYEADDQVATGLCARYPPTPFIHGPNQIRSVWPPVKSTFGCGEWRQRIFTAKDVQMSGTHTN